MDDTQRQRMLIIEAELGTVLTELQQLMHESNKAGRGYEQNAIFACMRQLHTVGQSLAAIRAR